jgi:hypothetical protein
MGRNMYQRVSRFIEQATLKIVSIERGSTALDTFTRTDYTVTIRLFDKHKVRLCVGGSQQQEGILYTGNQKAEFYVLAIGRDHTDGSYCCLALMQRSRHRWHMIVPEHSDNYRSAPRSDRRVFKFQKISEKM